MYTLYKTTERGGTELVGYYEDQMEAAAAIDEDRNKFDDNAEYRIKRDGDANDD